jgi:hypothetical protein
MASAGSDAGAGKAGHTADAGRGAPGPGQAEQAGQPAAGRPVPPEPVPPAPALPGPVLPEQSREDTDIAWGDYRGRDDEDRDRLYRDRPPHWADY